MEEWRLLRLEKLKGLTTQTIYHACGLYASKNKGMNIIILTEPTERFVCCGQSQNVSEEVDINYCNLHNIGYTRRITGGTTVFLDQNQVFYNVILYDYNFPTPLKLLYKKSLGGPVDFYNSLKINAYLNAFNEISVNNRKISGIGSCSLEKTGIVIGNIILDFDFDLCTNVMKSPSNNFKVLFKEYLKKSLTSIKKETGKQIEKGDIYDGLIACFEQNLKIKLIEDKLTNFEIKMNGELEESYKTEEWLNIYGEDSKQEKDFVKIKKGLFIFHYSPLKIDLVIEDDTIIELIGNENSKSLLNLQGLKIQAISEEIEPLKDIKGLLLKCSNIASN